MSNLENDLRNALTREEPTDGFAERVLQALPSQPSTVVLMPRRPKPYRMWLAAAAALAIGSGTLWLAVVMPGRGTEVVGGVTNVGVPGPRSPIFEGGIDRPTSKPTEPTVIEPMVPQPNSIRPGRVRRVNRVVSTPASAAQREEDVQAYLAARQLRLALTITSEKLRVAQRGITDRSELPAG